MINLVDDDVIEDVFENLQVNHVSGGWVGNASHRHFERVVMTMSKQVVAFVENALVLFVGERWVVQPVSGAEMCLARDVHHENS